MVALTVNLVLSPNRLSELFCSSCGKTRLMCGISLLVIPSNKLYKINSIWTGPFSVISVFHLLKYLTVFDESLMWESTLMVIW
jgi:hypothetical protein